jgi:hypothetical protein
VIGAALSSFVPSFVPWSATTILGRVRPHEIEAGD